MADSTQTGQPIATTVSQNPLDLASKQEISKAIYNLDQTFSTGFVNTLQTALDQIGNAQGDIIYRGASAWAALVAGTSGQFLKTQGASANPLWADALVSVHLQVFTSGGTYTPTTGLVVALLCAVGGGAGGGGAAASSAGNQGNGGGGGGGSTSLALKTAAQIGASQTVTIGAVANGGTAGNNNGTAGNDTSIGSLCVGKGGSSGGGAASNLAGNGGAGGVVGTGDIRIPGQDGTQGNGATIISLALWSGWGGSSGLGFGGGGTGVRNAGGNNGADYGGGGSGGASYNAGGAQAGGNGAQGLAWVLEWCKV